MKLKDFNLTKDEMVATCEKYMNEQFKRFDFIAESGKDMYLYDENGDGYLDFMGGIAVNAGGHCSQRVVDAIIDQARTLLHSSNYCYTVPQIMLAKLVCESIGMEKIQFQNSGAEANEAMIKLARKYGVDNFGPNRYKIVTAKNSFHGRTLATLAATGQPDSAIQKGYAPYVPGFSYADFNDLKSFEDACDEDTIAVMVEPIQGEGGVYPATKEFLQGLRDLCDRKNMLLLFDEVQTGWGRTGSLMAYMEYGVKPDVVSMAKAMGGGMPIGAMCTSEKLMQTFGPGAHGTTFGGNPVCCAAAFAEISDIIDTKLDKNAKEVGAYFREQLKELPHVKEVRGLGLLTGVEFDQPIAFDIKHNAADKKLLMTAVRPTVIRMVPPLIASKEDCDKAVAIIKEVIADLCK
ncbi:MAG: aspartate aminotransferase family protein [Eubacterium sp.]|nr:aspartate aminotransferase family protein [Eubacterium sp.]